MYAAMQSERGNKRICQGCSTKFYDLGRTPATCPKCQAEFVEPPARKSSAATGPKKVPWHSRSRPNPGRGGTPWAQKPGKGSPTVDTPPVDDTPVAAKESEDKDEDADGVEVQGEEVEEVEEEAEAAE